MTIEEQLKNVIIEQYGTQIEFAKQCGIPRSTLTTILKRGIDKASIQNMIKICEYLNIDLDILANDSKIVFKNEKANINSLNLSNKNELKLIKNYRKLTPYAQETVNDLVERMVIDYNNVINNFNFSNNLLRAAHGSEDLSDEELDQLEEAANKLNNME